MESMKISTRTLQYDPATLTFHGYLSDMESFGHHSLIEVESARTGTVVAFALAGSHWTPDHEGEPDGFFNYDLFEGEGFSLKMHNCGSIVTATEIPAEPGWGRILGSPVVYSERLPLEEEARREMEAEGKMIEDEEREANERGYEAPDQGWVAEFNRLQS